MAWHRAAMKAREECEQEQRAGEMKWEEGRKAKVKYYDCFTEMADLTSCCWNWPDMPAQLLPN
jgi:hypothetical protein